MPIRFPGPLDRQLPAIRKGDLAAAFGNENSVRYAALFVCCILEGRETGPPTILTFIVAKPPSPPDEETHVKGPAQPNERAYRLRTKAARTIGAYEPSEPWYGRFFADFLLVLLIVLSFQVIAPVVAILGLLYFMFAEVIYKYQLMHVYWPMYESGGIFFHQLFAQMVVGAVAGQITLLGFMLTRTTGVLQVSFLIPLPIVVLYLAGRWRQEAQRAAVSLSLDKAILQDRQDDIRVRSGADPIWESFSPTAYMQPSLLPGDPDAAFGNGEDGPQDSDVDVDGRLELDENGNVVCGNYCKALKKRRSKKRVPNFKDAARHPRIPLVKRLFARKDRDFASERRKVMKRTRSTSTAKLSSDASNRDMGGFNSNDIEDMA